MKKLSFFAAVCAAVFTFSYASAQTTDTTKTGTDDGTSVTQDTTVIPDGGLNGTSQDTVRGTLDNGTDQGIGTDTNGVAPNTDPNTDNGMGTDNNGNDIGTGNDNGTGTNGIGTDNRTGTGTDNRTGTDTGNGRDW